MAETIHSNNKPECHGDDADETRYHAARLQLLFSVCVRLGLSIDEMSLAA
jgi:hypothetical protein